MAEEPHEHVFQEVFQSETVGISEETTHQTITVEMYDRGLAMHMEREEALELARAFAALSRYLEEN